MTNKQKEIAKPKNSEIEEVKETNKSCVELRYSSYKCSYNDEDTNPKPLRVFRESVEDDKPYVYEWNKSYWTRKAEQDLEIEAMKWLETHTDRSKANSKTAKGCVATLKLKLKNEMVKPIEETIIPLQNKWLYVDIDNGEPVFRIDNPNRDYNIRYAIKTDLTGNKENNTYIPKDIPIDSKFYRYINETLPCLKTQSVVQEYIGYTLLNDCRYQVAMILEGEGSNGKSVLIELTEALHGNSATVDLTNLDGLGELKPLLYSSLITTAEVPKSGINLETLKKAIAGDTLRNRELHKNPISFKPFAKWLMSCNSFPILADKSDGIYRRIIVVKFLNRVVPGDKNYIPQLGNVLIKEELNIFLDWALIGLKRLLKRNRFDLPEELENLKEEKRTANDNVRMFIKENDYIAFGNEAYTDKNVIYGEYVEWCRKNGYQPQNNQNFFIGVKRIQPNFNGEFRKTIDKKLCRFCNLITLETKKANEEKIKKIMEDDTDPFATNSLTTKGE